MQSGRREDRLGLAPIAARTTGWLRHKYVLFETASGCTDTAYHVMSMQPLRRWSMHRSIRR